MKELQNIQSLINAPKSQFNKFGNYNYRSCEDIVKAVKPLLAENNCTLVMNDEIVVVGNRFYVKATATIRNSSGEEVSTVAYAREEESKKGMDGSQVTGASSSYARKYALNGLLCIDDTKDSDATNDRCGDVSKLLEEAKAEINQAKDVEALKNIFNKYTQLQGEKSFTSMLTTMRLNIQNNGK